MPERLDGVLKVLYLVFNEGYSASSGDALVRRELSAEAIRLARIVVSLLPDEPEATGLLALMLLHDARRDARVDAAGDLVLLEHQDRTRWDAERIDEGRALVERALPLGRAGPYQIQAAIAALHDDATTWGRDRLAADRRALPPASRARSVARGRAEPRRGRRDVRGPAVGLAVIDGVAAGGQLDGYLYLHAARADLLRRSTDAQRPRRPTVVPSSSRRTGRSGPSSSAGWPTWHRRVQARSAFPEVRSLGALGAARSRGRLRGTTIGVVTPGRIVATLDRPSVALALSAATILLPILFVVAFQPALDQPFAKDVTLYRDAADRWLAGGPFYEPRQLAGPYEVAHGDILYPPVGLWLFAPAAILPEIPALILWWGIPPPSPPGLSIASGLDPLSGHSSRCALPGRRHRSRSGRAIRSSGAWPRWRSRSSGAVALHSRC